MPSQILLENDSKIKVTEEIRMPPIEEYLKRADRLAQEVVNAWGLSTTTGHDADLTPEFKALFDKTCLFRTARKIADNHRKHSVLIEHDEAEEKATRQAFAESYKVFYERHAAKAST
jgi:hypothetical protein